jgi:hypothetical protein
VDHRPRTGVFVMTDAGEPVQSATDQRRVDRRWCDAELPTHLDRTQPPAPSQPHDLTRHIFGGAVRARTRTTRAINHPCLSLGAEPRPIFRAVEAETMNILAATVGDQSSSTISFASLNRARGVRPALAWDT